VETCSAPEGYVPRGGDCDDDEARVYPGAAEMCDGLDNNCNGVVDEEIVAAWYADGDGDGYGTGAAMLTCAPPAGWAPAGGDCDDALSAVNPGATETCNGVDDDCDGEVDEGLLTTFYVDGDGDGYGGAPVGLCAIMDGYVLSMGDCDDARVDVHPGATEVCNLVDDDCDGSVDEMLRPTLYRDVDGDGYGDPSLTSTARCSPGGGWVANADDCDDARPEAYLGATELCNGLDDDCDAVVDNGLASNTFYLDADGDGYGVTTTTVTACAAPPGYADNGDDCYDLNSDAYPGAPGYPHQSGVCTRGFIIGGCDAPDRGDGSYDYDCDGVERPYSTRRISACGGSCTAEGWTTSVPSCGGTGSFKSCSLVSAGCASATRLSTCQCCN